MVLAKVIEENPHFRLMKVDNPYPEETLEAMAAYGITDPKPGSTIYNDWLAKIPILDNIYLVASTSHGGICLTLEPESREFRTPPNYSNYEIIKDLAFAVEGDTVYVHNGKQLKRGEFFLDTILDQLGYEEWDSLTVEIVRPFGVLDTVSLNDFRDSMMALKWFLIEKDMYGFHTYNVSLSDTEFCPFTK